MKQITGEQFEAEIIKDPSCCKNLKVATGKFLNGVWFKDAGIEELKKLNIAIKNDTVIKNSTAPCFVCAL